MPKYTNPHKYVGPPDGKYNCRACGEPVGEDWVYFRGYYYHRDCLYKRYPKLKGGAV